MRPYRLYTEIPVCIISLYYKTKHKKIDLANYLFIFSLWFYFYFLFFYFFLYNVIVSIVWLRCHESKRAHYDCAVYVLWIKNKNQQEKIINASNLLISIFLLFLFMYRVRKTIYFLFFSFFFLYKKKKKMYLKINQVFNRLPSEWAVHAFSKELRGRIGEHLEV